MVPDAKSLLQFCESENGPFGLKNKGLIGTHPLLIDCSTIGPVKAIEMAELCK